ncbi:DUF4870 domain-containing protein [Endozoicomonas sp. OPT23]|uniref:DUF4870 domain-containing protein n=1 Tax=Endozoicomonas sp. OPT23 TaxID=2072845 RepID=UPI00129AE381|nr:DUF4870 domain-containing protein [Endozoicomonas sp. OPT23]MRI33062.1 DUF4870 domain-containing protein [Endozoicomonas sp. OPT23]
MNNDAPVEAVSGVSQDSKNLAILNWVGTLFLGFIPGLVLYLIKTDDAYIRDQSKEALNWSITSFIGFLIASALTFVGIGLLLYPIIGLCHLIFCILGAIGASKGDSFRVPWAIRLIK